MILVTGSIRARPDSVDEVVAVSLEHVRRSRGEPGCISHHVHRDVEDPLKLMFVEEWEDRAALDAHFAVPASLEFVVAVSALAAEQPVLNVYEAQIVRP